MPFVLHGLCKTKNAVPTGESQNPDCSTSFGSLVISFFGGDITHIMNMQELLDQLYNELKKRQDDGKNKKYLVQIAPLIATIQKACEEIRLKEFLELNVRDRIRVSGENKDCLEPLAQLINDGIAKVDNFGELIQKADMIRIADTVVTAFIKATRQVSFVF